MSITKLFDRAQKIATRAPVLVSRQRIVEHAAQIDRAALLQAQCDVCTAALAATVPVLYRIDADQRPANVDEVTGRILVPLPWGSVGWRHWGLRKWEAELLRRFLLDQWGSQRDKLFAYDRQSRAWHLDRDLYPTAKDAAGYVKDNAPTLQQWAALVDEHRARETRRLSMYR